MRKFFCTYNNLTERYQLSVARNGFMSPRINALAENTLLSEIREAIQNLYNQIVCIKEEEQDSDRLSKLDDCELLVSNLYYSIFAEPLNIETECSELPMRQRLNICFDLASRLESMINIAEQYKLCGEIKNIFQSLINGVK